ncbi:hypothetical protein EV421DRAFT_1912077 [Armillaria borealis]|uniref:Uncharacterized protein n=1 Tax=Armillaria borealis TaxID=47425 RepID=A0AA39IX57_9AGAR|nr:hypothetical protein EV421DRAFT_1912077 [Armillaria borealis]
MAVALDPTIARVDARISAALECGYSGSSFLALVTKLHGVTHAIRHQFVPVAIRGSCLVDDEDQWPSDPGYKVERALFGGIVGVSFAGSPTDPDLPEISHFTYTPKTATYVETIDSWIEGDEHRPFNLEQLRKQEIAKGELARPVLRNYKALLDKFNTLGLGFLELLLGDEDDDSEESSKDDLAEIIKAWKRPHKVQSSVKITFSVLEDRLGLRMFYHDWNRSRMDLWRDSKYYAVDLEPLYQELEAIYESSNPRNLVASRRSIVNAYLTFIVTTTRKEREGRIRTAFKARIEASPSLDITPLMPHTESDQVLSSFLKSPEGAGSPSTLEEFSIDDKVNFRIYGIFTCMKGWPSTLLSFKGASQDAPGLTLSGVVDYGILVFKTRDSGKVYYARPEGVVCGSLKAGELRLLYVETEMDNEGRIRFIDDDPVVEATAQALALSTMSNRPNIRFIVTNSSEWMLAHLRNGPNPEITSMSSIETLKCDHPFKKSYGSVEYRERVMSSWRRNVQEVFVTVAEWLAPESESLIKSPPPSSA